MFIILTKFTRCLHNHDNVELDKSFSIFSFLFNALTVMIYRSKFCLTQCLRSISGVTLQHLKSQDTRDPGKWGQTIEQRCEQVYFLQVSNWCWHVTTYWKFAIKREVVKMDFTNFWHTQNTKTWTWLARWESGHWGWKNLID